MLALRATADTDGASLTLMQLTFCCAAQFLTGPTPVPAHGPGVGDPCPIQKEPFSEARKCERVRHSFWNVKQPRMAGRRGLCEERTGTAVNTGQGQVIKAFDVTLGILDFILQQWEILSLQTEKPLRPLCIFQEVRSHGSAMMA